MILITFMTDVTVSTEGLSDPVDGCLIAVMYMNLGSQPE